MESRLRKCNIRLISTGFYISVNLNAKRERKKSRPYFQPRDWRRRCAATVVAGEPVCEK